MLKCRQLPLAALKKFTWLPNFENSGTNCSRLFLGNVLEKNRTSTCKFVDPFTLLLVLEKQCWWQTCHIPKETALILDHSFGVSSIHSFHTNDTKERAHFSWALTWIASTDRIPKPSFQPGDSPPHGFTSAVQNLWPTRLLVRSVGFFERWDLKSGHLPTRRGRVLLRPGLGIQLASRSSRDLVESKSLSFVMKRRPYLLVSGFYQHED